MRFDPRAIQIDDRNELEQILRQIKPFGDRLQQPLLEKYGKSAGFITIILMLLVFISNDRTIVTASAALLLGLMGWSFSETLR